MRHRYVIALIAAVLVIGGGIVFVQSTYSFQGEILERLKQDLKRQKQAGQLPDQVTDERIDRLTLEEVYVPLTQNQMIRIDITNLLINFWYLWIALVILVCLLLARLSRFVWKVRAV